MHLPNSVGREPRPESPAKSAKMQARFAPNPASPEQSGGLGGGGLGPGVGGRPNTSMGAGSARRPMTTMGSPADRGSGPGYDLPLAKVKPPPKQRNATPDE